MVVMRVLPATGLFHSTKGIGSQALAGAAVDKESRRAGKTCCMHRASGFQSSKSVGFRVRHSPCCTLFLINGFGIEMVSCNLYLKRFNLTKGLLSDIFLFVFDTFIIIDWYKLCRCDY